MRYRIHYTLSDGSEDSFVLEAETLGEIQSRAKEELEARGASNYWSEAI